MTNASTHQILGDELIHLLSLIDQANSVELKLTVPDEGHRSALAALGVDPLEAQIRQVFFFDTPDLALDGAGVVARVRRIQGRDADAVVKLRPVVPSELPDDVRASSALTVEVDAMPGGYVCSATLKTAVPAGAVLPAVSGEKKVSKLFTTEQKKFYAAHAPKGLGLDDLSTLGPIFVLKAKVAPKDAPQRIVIEMWLYPDGSRILELSSKSAPAQALPDAVRLRQYLESIGIGTTGEQQTKTRTALNFFAAELKAQGR